MRFGCDFQLKQINSARSVDQVKLDLAVNCSQNGVKMKSKSAQLEHSNRQGGGHPTPRTRIS